MIGRPTIRISMNGRTIDNFVPVERTLAKEYVVDRAALGSVASVIVVIQTSVTVRAPGDTRTLGIAIERVEWARMP